MPTPRDIDLKVYIDGVTYLALKERCRACDRTLSEHVRHLIRADLLAALAEEGAIDRGERGVPEGHPES
jgi:hypothetical protein